MLVFPESRPAVSAVLEIDRVTSAEPQFPAVRSGAHHGPLLYREGDYYGTTVNIAARIAAEAERHQLLVSAAVRTGAGSVPEVEFVPLGRRRLRGLTEDIEVFAARRSDRDRPERRVIDPVCGMELDESEAAATLSLAGRNEAFCSQQCLQLFAAAPARYARTPVESS
jgi:class 3 adenylate cyclase/YHS domain-containing protein